MTGRPPAVDAGAEEALAGLLSAARGSSPPDTATALAALSAARRLAGDLERGELALIEAARSGGASWSQISAAVLGARNQQTAQKRHAGLARRFPRPPSVDTAPRNIPGARPAPAAGSREAGDSRRPGRSAPPPPGPKAAARPRVAISRITVEIIAEARYELARAPDWAETRAWHVLVAGRPVGPCPPDLARRAQQARLGTRRPVWPPAARQGHREGHPGRERAHPRRRRPPFVDKTRRDKHRPNPRAPCVHHTCCTTSRHRTWP